MLKLYVGGAPYNYNRQIDNLKCLLGHCVISRCLAHLKQETAPRKIEDISRLNEFREIEEEPNPPTQPTRSPRPAEAYWRGATAALRLPTTHARRREAAELLRQGLRLAFDAAGAGTVLPKLSRSRRGVWG